jgi:hypothetical protein
VLRERIIEREPTEWSAIGQLEWIDKYHARDDLERIRDFRVVTHPVTIEESADEILRLTGWMS